MFDRIINLEFASLVFCEVDKSAFWNNALTNTVLTKDQVLLIENHLHSLNRTPAIYFENKDGLKTLIDFLQDNDYKHAYEDSWMFWTGEQINKEGFNKVKKVTTETELEEFLHTFDACYQKDDPQNPYGELGDYLRVAKGAWLKHHANDRVEYFVVYKDSKPVAVSTLTNFQDIGYISNVGSLQSVRGEGYGKLATLYCVEKSKNNSNTEHCLATEEGTFPNEFYKRIGFQTRFTAVCYVKTA